MPCIFIQVVGLLLLCGCCGQRSYNTNGAPAPTAAIPSRPALINHVVFFKLKESAHASELIADCDRMLSTIPGVVSYFAGRHADTGRTTVDSNYDVGFFVGFMNEADYAAYVQHPNHIAAVEKWRPRWEWIRIYDVLDATP